MEKKMYIIPLIEVNSFESEVMYITGQASPAPDPHAGGAPRRHDDPVPVF